MKDFLRQNGILLLVAAVLLSVALSLGSAVFGGTDPVSNAVNAVATPFRTGVSAVLDWFGGVQDYVLHYDQLHEELDSLRARVAELEDEVRQNEEAAKENEKLRELLDLPARYGILCAVALGYSDFEPKPLPPYEGEERVMWK